MSKIGQRVDLFRGNVGGNGSGEGRGKKVSSRLLRAFVWQRILFKQLESSCLSAHFDEMCSQSVSYAEHCKAFTLLTLPFLNALENVNDSESKVRMVPTVRWYFVEGETRVHTKRTLDRDRRKRVRMEKNNGKRARIEITIQ